MSVEEQRDQFFEMLLRQLTIERARVNVELYEEATRSDRLGQILRSSDKQVRTLIKKMYRSRAGAGLSEEALEELARSLEVADVQRDVLDSHVIPFMVGSATAG